MKNPVTTIQFLDAIKRRYDLPSDGAISRKIGVSRQTISKYRHNKDYLGDETALRVASVLDLDPGYVISCAYAERCKAAPVRAVWLELARRSVAAALVAIVAGSAWSTLLYPIDSIAESLKGSASNTVYYVKWRILRLFMPLLGPGIPLPGSGIRLPGKRIRLLAAVLSFPRPSWWPVQLQARRADAPC